MITPKPKIKRENVAEKRRKSTNKSARKKRIMTATETVSATENEKGIVIGIE